MCVCVCGRGGGGGGGIQCGGHFILNIMSKSLLTILNDHDSTYMLYSVIIVTRH